jgi:outer membrane autotransporter protein
VTGGTAGIYGRILNPGSGSLSITTTGAVTATNGIGVNGRTYGSGGLTIQTADVTGGTVGIWGRNLGSGALSITSTGTVKGITSDGINAAGTGTNLTIQAANVSGAQYGIRVYNSGSGALSITTTGTVTAANRGMYVKNYGTSLTIQTAAVTGSNRYGIDARNFGSGALSITATGTVKGGVGIYAFTTAGHSIGITNTNLGTIENTTGVWTSIAIRTAGGPTTIVNDGVLTGVVHLGPGFVNSLTNSGTWNTLGGGNVFSGADTVTNNAGGTIVTAMAGAVAPVTTTFTGLASFTNTGLITMRNGVAGDQTVFTSNFIGRGGAVALDVALGADNSVADQLVFKGGNASGTTNLLIYNVGGLGALTTADGIQVVKVQNGGTTTSTAFQLGRTVAAGAYTYTLFYGGNGATGGNPSDQDWYLRSTLTPIPPAAPAPAPPLYPNYRAEVPVYLAMPELANQVGFAMIDSFDARMEGWRGSAAPDASPANAFACMAPGDDPGAGCQRLANETQAVSQARDNELEANRRSATWGRVFGAFGAQTPGHNSSMAADNDFLNGRGPQYSFSFGGLQTGMDLWRHDGADSSSDRAGLYTGYINASSHVSQVYTGVYASNLAGTLTMSGYSVGAYWTHFGPAGWYVDSVLQGTWFDQVRGQTVNTGMGVGGLGLTASLAGGYPLHFADRWTLEPLAQLIYQHAKLASGADIYGDTSLGGTDDARGQIGAKLSYAALLGEGASARPVTFSVRASLWHDFLVNAPSATFSTLTGSFPMTLNGTLGGTWGEVDARADVRIARNVSLFGAATYDHSVDNGASWSVSGRLGAQVQF